MEILLNPEPEDALRSAALRPALHKEMWEKYGTELPSERNLRYQLMRQGFTESGVADFLKVYRDTVMFAGLDETDERRDDKGSEGEALGDDSPDSTAFYPPRVASHPDEVARARRAAPQIEEGGHRTPLPHAVAHPYAAPQAPPSGLRIPVPLVGGMEVVYVEGNFPITEQAWGQLMTMLSAMKPGLVKPEE
jgi:hypothetical protein